MSKGSKPQEAPAPEGLTVGGTARSLLREWAEALLIAATFLCFGNTFIVQTFYIPSGSMEDTLLIGDRLFVNRFIYGPETLIPALGELLPRRDVEPGDIVVFRSLLNRNEDLVKRCIAKEGDTVQVIDRDLYVNGEPVPEAAYVKHIGPASPAFRFDQANDGFYYYGPVEVPEGHYFCMGDNRENSFDSRKFGPVPREHIKGRALMIYWSYAGGDPRGDEGDAPLSTRWDRTFQLIE